MRQKNLYTVIAIAICLALFGVLPALVWQPYGTAGNDIFTERSSSDY
jgi:hypothetical protein